jgi:hypothetical protein
MPMNLSTIVKQSKDQASCCLNEEVAILNLQSAMYFGLDEVGAFIWQALNEPRPMSEICSIVLESFEVDTERCRTDVFNFITKLEKEGLVELEEASGGVRAPVLPNAAHT